MKTQTRHILSVVSLAIMALIVLFLSPIRPGYASSPAAKPQADGLGTMLYLPLLQTPNENNGLSFELTNDTVLYYIDELSGFDLSFVRGNLGNVNDPLAAPYQAYLAGGWAAADAKMLPNIDGWREIGAEPVMVFMPGIACGPPSYATLDSFGDFIAQAVERYDLTYFEVWNEPDAVSGAPSLYGCLGPQHVDKLIYLLERIRPQLDSHRQMGVSFTMEKVEHFNMLKAVAPYLDFVGIHHYGIWLNGEVLEPDWPGSLPLKYNLVKDAVNIPVWITELNLRSPNDECGQAHQIAARAYVEAGLELKSPMTSILVYKKYPDWQCTGIQDTLLETRLLSLVP